MATPDPTSPQPGGADRPFDRLLGDIRACRRCAAAPRRGCGSSARRPALARMRPACPSRIAAATGCAPGWISTATASTTGAGSRSPQSASAIPAASSAWAFSPWACPVGVAPPGMRAAVAFRRRRADPAGRLLCHPPLSAGKPRHFAWRDARPLARLPARLLRAAASELAHHRLGARQPLVCRGIAAGVAASGDGGAQPAASIRSMSSSLKPK
jgi:hypothetical protein